MEIKTNNGNVFDARQAEQMAADLKQQQATMDYIAMMADIDLPEEEGVDEDE